MADVRRECAEIYACAREYELLSFEPYTMMYVKVVVFGDAEAEAPVLLSYENPDVKEFPILPDEEAERIFRAAKETFAQNAVDVLTDCPSRERSGGCATAILRRRRSMP